MLSIPSIFLPLNLRQNTRYRSLCRHKFTWEEVHWICKVIEVVEKKGVDPNIERLCLGYDMDSIEVNYWYTVFKMYHNDDEFQQAFEDLMKND